MFMLATDLVQKGSRMQSVLLPILAENQPVDKISYVIVA